ncbi:MAG: PLP-dependent aminotransferase family protein [Rhodobacteraceae bacterium]|nr:PLP-dependent aminotransferase family protein [Paracoccaceae bacterium]
MAIPVETFFLALDHQGTLQSQVQEMIAQGVLAGRFLPGEKLPSTRKLASHLGVSRITVSLAFTELVANEYLTSRGRSGYYISENAPIPPNYSPAPKSEDAVDWQRAIAHRFSGGLTITRPPDWAQYRFPFIYGQADPRLFDHASWRLCALQALGQRDFRSLTTDYYDQDDPQLTEFIARNTLARRGITANPDDVLITLGAQNALWLAVTVLLSRRRTAAFEDPCYPALRELLTQANCNLQPVRVDAKGLPPDAIGNDVDVIVTTPSHQSPTGATLPMSRRQDLLDRARELDAIIIEDDYEFEMAFPQKPSPALKSMDRDGRVVYVGSFSKSLFPGLRLGFLVGSKRFLREARALRALVLRHPPGHVQRTAAYFLSLGHFDAQIRRMAKELHARRDIMRQAISDHALDYAGPASANGSAFWMRAAPEVDTEKVARTLRTRSVLIEPGHAFFGPEDDPQSNFYRLGFSSIPKERIPEGIAYVADALKSGLI